MSKLTVLTAGIESHCRTGTVLRRPNDHQNLPSASILPRLSDKPSFPHRRLYSRCDRRCLVGVVLCSDPVNLHSHRGILVS